MKKNTLNELFEKIQKLNIEDYLIEEFNGELGLNPTIVFQVVDDDFEYGYWDYFFQTPVTNSNWFNDFQNQFDIYVNEVKECLEEVEDNVTDDDVYATIRDIHVYVSFYDDIDDTRPYAYWNCLEGIYYEV
jgi:hypothetical protein